MSGYEDFLASKAQLSGDHGFAPAFMPDAAFDFQRFLIEWSVQKGRGAVLADCGLGKSLIQLTWAQNVHLQTGKPVLILTPLAVSHQTVSEGEKFGIEAHRSDGALYPITVTNYEKLHLFSPDDFAGTVCDESSILKSFSGVRRKQITEFMRRQKYRHLCTATAAPNDFTELGTSSEALGYLGHMDMLSRFFKNDQGTANVRTMRFQNRPGAKWRFRGHSEEPFWKWVCSWARACRKPSDLGFDDSAFVLPPLEERHHVVSARTMKEGMLFSVPAVGLAEEREERRRTIEERCEMVAELVAHGDQAAVWCHLNAEGDLLEDLIPDAVQVSGSDSDDAKEEKLSAFAGGQSRVLVTKPKIGAWGLNLQRCAHVVTFPSHSYEQYYQLVRRCWRFGQTRTVKVDVVTTEGEAGIMANMRAKKAQAERMFEALVSHMNEALGIERTNPFTETTEAPEWLSASNS